MICSFLKIIESYYTCYYYFRNSRYIYLFYNQQSTIQLYIGLYLNNDNRMTSKIVYLFFYILLCFICSFIKINESYFTCYYFRNSIYVYLFYNQQSTIQLDIGLYLNNDNRMISKIVYLFFNQQVIISCLDIKGDIGEFLYHIKSNSRIWICHCFHIKIHVNINYLIYKALWSNKVIYFEIICYFELFYMNYYHSIRHTLSIMFKLLVISSHSIYSIWITFSLTIFRNVNMLLWSTAYLMYIYNYESTKVCSITNTNLNYFLIFPQFTTNVKLL